MKNRGWSGAAMAVALMGCSSAPEPRVVRVNDMERMAALAEGQAIVIEFQAGDTLPLDFVLQGPLLASEEPAQPIVLTAKRRFFLRVDDDGLAASLDGKDFSRSGAKPGSFQIGIGATKERGTRASVKITGPELAEPPAAAAE